MAITKAIIPVAGLGTRFLPATKAQPKEMLTLVDKPVIQYIVEEAVAAGIKDIIIVTSQNKRAIEDHFDRNFELEYRLEQNGKTTALRQVKDITKLANFIYIRQKSPRGWGDAMLHAESILEGEPFAYLAGDDVVASRTPAIGQLMRVYKKYGDGVLGVTRVAKRDTGRYGIVDGVKVAPQTYEVKRLVEKPDPKTAPSTLAVAGRYIFTPDIFPALRKTPLNKRHELVGTNAIKLLMKNKPFYAYEYDGVYHDCGSKIEFLKATVAFGLQHKELGRTFRAYLKKNV
jgi:UTP--glucose-1-phosphate uridylyltransferase